jgi:3-isopropylmalate dehydrogenase
LKVGALCTVVTTLRDRVVAISQATRAPRFAPLRVTTRMPIEISSFGRNSPEPATTVHKAPTFKLVCGMFAEECHKAVKDYPGVKMQDVLIDSFALKLAMKPQQFDVVVTTNTFGDILTDLGAGLAGGLGLAPGMCVGETQAMAQATHGSAPDIAGRGIANPYAMIMSGKMMLEWLGHKHNEPKAVETAAVIDAAVERVIAAARELTSDLGGTATTQQMGSAIAAAV